MENWYLICVRNIEDHVAPQHSVLEYQKNLAYIYRVVQNYWYWNKRLFRGFSMDAQKNCFMTNFCLIIKADFIIKYFLYFQQLFSKQPLILNFQNAKLRYFKYWHQHDQEKSKKGRVRVIKWTKLPNFVIRIFLNIRSRFYESLVNKISIRNE